MIAMIFISLSYPRNPLNIKKIKHHKMVILMPLTNCLFSIYRILGLLKVFKMAELARQIPA